MPDIALSQIALLHQFSYLGVFISIVAAGHFVPVPEDVSILLAGYVVALGYAKLLPMILISIVGPIIADAILYFLAKKGSKWVPPIERYAPGLKIEFVRRQLEEHTFRSVFWMRFVTGFRFLSPVLSGYMKIDTKRYFLANAFSALFYGPTLVLIGYFLSSKITKVLGTLKSIEHVLLFVIGVGVIVGGSILLSKYISSRK